MLHHLGSWKCSLTSYFMEGRGEFRDSWQGWVRREPQEVAANGGESGEELSSEDRS